MKFAFKHDHHAPGFNPEASTICLSPPWQQGNDIFNLALQRTTNERPATARRPREWRARRKMPLWGTSVQTRFARRPEAWPVARIFGDDHPATCSHLV